MLKYDRFSARKVTFNQRPFIYIGVGNASFTVAGAMWKFIHSYVLLSYVVISIYSFFFSVSEGILAFLDCVQSVVVLIHFNPYIIQIVRSNQNIPKML